MSVIKIFFMWALLAFPIVLFAPELAISDQRVRSAGGEYIEVEIYRLAEDPRNNQPVVLLTDPDERRAMPIWIGPFEAGAINAEMTGARSVRPQTHDLLQSIIREADLKITRVTITHVDSSVYYASIMIEKGDSSVIEVDSRPSDSIVMALKFNVPVSIPEKLFADKSFPLDREEEEEEEEEQWYRTPGRTI